MAIKVKVAFADEDSFCRGEVVQIMQCLFNIECDGADMAFFFLVRLSFPGDCRTQL